MIIAPHRNRLTPWYIGVVIIAAAVGYLGYYVSVNDCGASPALLFAVLLVIPVVYLTLMYMTLTSQR